MTPDRWRTVKQLFHHLLELRPEDRGERAEPGQRARS